ncbi:MAG: hemolysin III family protein [Lachnospiraceae bacterium]
MHSQKSIYTQNNFTVSSRQNHPLKNTFVHLKDPGSAITHGIGAILSLLAIYPLLKKTFFGANSNHILSIAIFILSMVILYTASTIYHSIRCSKEKETILRKLDHAMIFVLIAGSYTPICRIVLTGKTGTILLAFVWGLSILGILFKIFWITCPKYLSSILYIALGWACIFAFVPLIHSLSAPAFALLLIGGILYTVGGIIYAIKPPIFQIAKYFGNHEVFHIFVMLGSLCHFLVIYLYLA